VDEEADAANDTIDPCGSAKLAAVASDGQNVKK